MFTPRQIIFAPTAACNLQCAHCRVDRDRGAGTERLSIQDAQNFLRQCAGTDIDRIGFSGGEPFLAVDFITALCATAVELDLYFDRLMTNAMWFTDGAVLRSELERVCQAGFDGTIAVSVDDYHNPDSEKLALFISTAFEVFGRRDCIELVSVLDREGNPSLSHFRTLAQNLGAELCLNDGLPVNLQDARAIQNRRSGMSDGSGLYIPIVTLPYSASVADSAAWKAERWFTDDFCEGPGNIFYVHPDGSVAVCCGFANENSELIVGTVRDSYSTLMDRARANTHIQDCYEKGLDAKRLEMEKEGIMFPGKTADICFFCDYLCRNTGK